MGHDLGHTPFGHQGERTLDEILCGKIDVGINATQKMFEKRCFGGFKHNYQSANSDNTQNALKSLQHGAINQQNLFELMMEAVKYCSLGQITNALFEVGGMYRRNM